MAIKGVEDIGLRVRKRREKLKISQAELSRMVGIAQPTLHNFEIGKARGSVYVLEIVTALDMWPEILEALGVRLRSGPMEDI